LLSSYNTNAKGKIQTRPYSRKHDEVSKKTSKRIISFKAVNLKALFETRIATHIEILKIKTI
jgi:hypothetical protein